MNYPHDAAWRAAGLPIPAGLRVGYDEDRDAYFLFDIAGAFAADRPRVTIEQVRAVKHLLREGLRTRVEIHKLTKVSRPTILEIETGSRFWYV